jgi:hypothetical protein
MTALRARAAVAALAIAATLAIAIAPAAVAAAPWSTPLDTGPPSDFADVIGLGFAPSGLDVVGWTHDSTSLIARGRSTVPQGSQRIVGAPLAAGPQFDAQGRGVILTAQPLKTKPAAPTRTRLAWARVTARGVPGRLHTLATATYLTGPWLAGNARGDAIAAWTEQIVLNERGDSKYRTWATYRARGGSFGRPEVVFDTPAHDDGNPISVAVGRDGRAVVVEANTSKIRVRMRTARRGFGAVRGFGFQHGLTQTAAAISDGGRTIVVWGTQDAGEQADTPWVVSAARLRAGTTRFFEQTLDHGGLRVRPEGRIALAIGRDERATVAWSAMAPGGVDGVLFPIMTARSDRAGFFAPKRRIAPSGAVGDVAIRADGATIVVWSSMRQPQLTDQAQAAVRPAGARSFGPVELLGPLDLATPPRVAFNPLTGRPVAAWIADTAPFDPAALDPTSTVLRIATRAAP